MTCVVDFSRKILHPTFCAVNSERDGLKMEGKMKGCKCLTKILSVFLFWLFYLSSKFSLCIIQTKPKRKIYKQDMNKKSKNLQNIILKPTNFNVTEHINCERVSHFQVSRHLGADYSLHHHKHRLRRNNSMNSGPPFRALVWRTQC